MARSMTYDESKLIGLKARVDVISGKFRNLGRGSRVGAAEWLIAHGYESSSIDQVAKKVANILSGYIRGIHPTMRNGGVWRPEEAERIIDHLEQWLRVEIAPNPNCMTM